MKKYEANTIQEACQLASKDNNCSITDLEYKIIQHPKNGFLGLFAKKAIIQVTNVKKPKEKDAKKKPLKEVQEQAQTKIQEDISAPKKPTEDINIEVNTKDNEVLNSFFNEKQEKKIEPTIDAQTVESNLKKLFEVSCLDIDTVEVDIQDNTAYIFIDGNDSALLIGKEGYRYNALSYLLYNWLNSKYNLNVKLEIAEFLSTQKEMVINLIQPVIEHVNQTGWGKTKPLDGILVLIALEHLRETFPNKYVAIKTTPDGKKYVLVNEFNRR